MQKRLCFFSHCECDSFQIPGEKPSFRNYLINSNIVIYSHWTTGILPSEASLIRISQGLRMISAVVLTLSKLLSHNSITKEHLLTVMYAIAPPVVRVK